VDRIGLRPPGVRPLAERESQAARIFDPNLVSSDPSGSYNGIDALLGYVQG